MSEIIQPTRNVTGLWKYGWADRHEICLRPCRDVDQLVVAYLLSDYFATTFLGRELTIDKGIHGPFRTDSIRPRDFRQIDKNALADQIRNIRYTFDFELKGPVTDEQWHTIEKIVAELQTKYSWILMLCLNEKDKEKFYDLGFILGMIFREFLFANPDEGKVTRLIFSLD